MQRVKLELVAHFMQVGNLNAMGEKCLNGRFADI